MDRDNPFDPSKIRTGGKSLVCTAHAAFALRADGTVAAAGENRHGECDVQGWRDIVALACSDTHTVGLKKDGTVVAAGLNEFGECDVSGWSDVVAITCSNVHTVGLKEDGTVVAAGANGDGQCDVGDMEDIAAVASATFETIGVDSNGAMVATRQLSVRLKLDAREAFPLVGKDFGGALLTDCVGHINNGMCIDRSGRGRMGNYRDIVTVAWGRNHVAGILSDGRVEAVGGNEYGQGHVDDFRNIIDITCGEDYTAGLREDGTVVAAGNIRDFDFCDGRWKDIVMLGGGKGFVIGIRADGTAVMTGTEEMRASLEREVAAWSNIEPEDVKRSVPEIREADGAGISRDELSAKEIPVEQESQYNILVNDENEIMISIKERESEPQNPVLVYAGGKHALLYRNPELTVLLDYVHPDVRNLLRSASEALVAELRDGDFIRIYQVPVRQTDVLSLAEDQISGPGEGVSCKSRRYFHS